MKRRSSDDSSPLAGPHHAAGQSSFPPLVETASGGRFRHPGGVTDFSDPSVAAAQERRAFFADLVSTLPAGGWEAREDADGTWSVHAGSHRIADGLSKEVAGAVSAACAFMPRALGYWGNALDALTATQALATTAGADPTAVALAAAGAAPGDARELQKLEDRLAELGGVRDDEAAIDETVRRILEGDS